MSGRDKEYVVNIAQINQLDHKVYIAKLNDGTHVKLPQALAHFFRQFNVSFCLLDLKKYMDALYDSEVEWHDVYDIVTFQLMKKNIIYEKGEKPIEKKKNKRLSLSGLSFNITVLRKNNKVANSIKLGGLFRTDVMIGLTALSVITCIVMYFVRFKTIHFSYDPYTYYQTYALICIGCVVHEMGHIAACNKFNVRISGVGIGIFFVFLRIFVQIDSEVWEKPKLERAIIDIAGVYFQTIYMAILALLTLVYPVAYLGLSGNLYLIILNLCPIFFFDGKWVMIDLLGEKRILPYYTRIIKKREFTGKNIFLFIGLTVYFLFYAYKLFLFFFTGYERARSLPLILKVFWHSLFSFQRSYGYLNFINLIILSTFHLIMSLMIFVILLNIAFPFLVYLKKKIVGGQRGTTLKKYM